MEMGTGMRIVVGAGEYTRGSGSEHNGGGLGISLGISTATSVASLMPVFTPPACDYFCPTLEDADALQQQQRARKSAMQQGRVFDIGRGKKVVLV